MYFFPNLEPVHCSVSCSNCYFLTCIQIFPEAGNVVWYPHFFQNFPKFDEIHTVKGFSAVSGEEVVLFLEFPCFLCDPISSVQLLSHVWPFVTPWTVAPQASLSIANSWRSPKHMSIESVRPSDHLILCRPLLLLPSIFLSIRVFSNQSVQSIGVSASASVLPMNIQDWSPLGWIGWISLQSKGPSRVFSNTTLQKHQFFGTKLSL